MSVIIIQRCFEAGQKLFIFIKVIIFQNHHKFIPANAVDRTALKYLTDQLTGINDQYVAKVMAQGVVDYFQVIDVEYNHCKFRPAGPGPFLQVGNCFLIGGFILYPGEGIPVSKAVDVINVFLQMADSLLETVGQHAHLVLCLVGKGDREVAFSYFPGCFV